MENQHKLPYDQQKLTPPHGTFEMLSRLTELDLCGLFF